MSRTGYHLRNIPWVIRHSWAGGKDGGSRAVGKRDLSRAWRGTPGCSASRPAHTLTHTATPTTAVKSSPSTSTSQVRKALPVLHVSTWCDHAGQTPPQTALGRAELQSHVLPLPSVFLSSRTAPGDQCRLAGQPSLGPGKGSKSLDKTHPELGVRSNSGSPDAGPREALCSRPPAAGNKAHP